MEEIKLFENINRSIYVNHLVYFFRSLPFIKKRASGFYEFSEESGLLSKVFRVLPYIGTLVKYILALFILTIFTFSIVENREDKLQILQNMIFYSFTIYSLFDSLEMDNAKLFVQQMKFSQRNFAIGRYIIKFKRNLVIKILVLCIMAFIIHVPVWKMLILALLSSAFNLVSVTIVDRIMNTKFYRKRETVLTIISLVLATFFIGVMLFISAKYTVSNIIIITMKLYLIPVIILLFYIGYRLLIGYQNYGASVRSAIQKNYQLFVTTQKEDAVLREVSLAGKNDLKVEYKTEKYEKLKGTRYLNRIFFIRNRKQIRNHFLITAGLFTVSAIAISAIDFFTRENVLGELLNITGLWVMMAFIGTNTRTVVKSMFYNCDRSLLRYSFYKTERNIIESFVDRLKYVSMINITGIMIPFTIFAIYLTIFNKEALGALGIKFLFVASLVLLVGTLELALYYLIQPFSIDAEVKSPLYKAFAIPAILVFYFQRFIPNFSLRVTLIIALICIVGSIILAITVYKLAPKTFKIR